MPSIPETSTLPLISVIVPIHNDADFLPGLLDNLRAQAYQPLDIILVDDGSTDDSAAVAARCCIDTPAWRVCCIRQENAGLSAARNAGLSAAQADLIQFLDVDDLLPPNKLRDQARRLLRQPELDVVSGYTQVINLPGADVRNMYFGRMEPFAGYNVGAALFRRRVFERIGGFDPAFHLAEDVDFFCRAIEANCPLVIMRRVTLYYRQHDRNTSRGYSPREHKVALAKAIQESAKRRRRQAGGFSPPPQLLDFIEPEEIA